MRKVLALSLLWVGLGSSLLMGYSDGPPVRHTGAPGDDPRACASAGCHTTAFNPPGGGVDVRFPSGLTYTPGQAQTLTVTIADSAGIFFGFQLSARLASDPANAQAGDLSPGPGLVVLCDDGAPKSSKGCPAATPVQFIEHNTPATKAGVWQFTWIPPSSNMGNIEIYVAGNANRTSGSPLGANIYTSKYTLVPSGAPAPKPSITPGGIVSASAFSAKAGLTAGTWLEIFGVNLSNLTGEWTAADFKNGEAPTQLNGVSVSINGKPAFVRYTSPGQVNVLSPDDPALGPVPLTLTNSAGVTDTVTLTKLAAAPALLAPPAFLIDGKQFVAAQFADGGFAGKTRPAQFGDILVIYGIGFGAVKPIFRIGGAESALAYSGLAPNFLGLYQFNVVVPNVGPGDVPLDAGTGQQLYLTLK